MRLRLGIAAAAAGLGLVGPVAAQSPADALPDGPGKDVTLRVCTMCHEASQFAYSRMSPAEWDTEISKMQDAGAIMSAEDQLAISAYLGKYLSKAAPPATGAPTADAKAPSKP
jgi:cytochrome c5